jgi:hypothetical protein
MRDLKDEKLEAAMAKPRAGEDSDAGPVARSSWGANERANCNIAFIGRPEKAASR